MYWLDYSAAKLSGATIRNAGYGGAIRYIDAPDRLRTKHTNKAEYDDLIRNGLQVRLVMQNTTTDADGGWNAGVANAQRAKAGADMLGYTGVIFFTNDRTTVPNPGAWTAYLDGAASVLGKARVGAYGFANALNLAKGHASAFWQAGRRSDLVPHANFWQDNNTQVKVGGITCDRNLVIKDYVPGGGGATGGSTQNKIKDEDRMAELKAGNNSASFACKGAKQMVISSPYAEDLKIWDCTFWGPYGTFGDNKSGRGGKKPQMDGWVKDHYDWVVDLPSDILSVKLWWEIKNPQHAGSIQFVY